MKHLKNNFIRYICILLMFTFMCGSFAGFRLNVNAAGSTVLFNGAETEIQVNGAASAEGNNYTFTDTLKINLLFPIDTSFNRYTLVYTSDAHLKGTIFYTVSNSAYHEDFFLEPGTHKDFSSLIDGYTNNQTGARISKIELNLINTNKATFSLEQINTTVYKVQTDTTVYLENDRFKLGVHLLWGGGLSYLEDKKDGDNTVTNMLNNHDTGRLVQQSYYGTSSAPYVGAYFGGNLWSYNPVQGGDQYGNKSKLVDFAIYEDSIYVKCRPLDWAQNNQYTLSYMENRYIITDEYISVDNRFIDFSTYNHGPDKDQELPAFYTISYLDTFTFYNGTKPWTNGSLTVKKNLPFWGGNPDCYFKMENGNTETWCAWTSSGKGYGLGLYTPNITTLLAGRNAYNGSKSAGNDATNYVAPLIRATMKNCEAFEYRYLITAGTVDTIRSVFSENRDAANHAWDKEGDYDDVTPPNIEILPLDGNTLRSVNDADGLYGADGAQGYSFQNTGHWFRGTGSNGDYLVPFCTEVWASGTTNHLVFMNYDNFIRISKNIDLSKYSKAYITYSVSADPWGNPTNVSGNKIGFFSKPNAFGQNDLMRTEGLLAFVDINSDYVDKGGRTANWNVFNTIEVDLSGIDYSGELYLSYYMMQPNGVCVTNIEFEISDGDDQEGRTPGEGVDFRLPNEHVIHVSYDEIRPGIICNTQSNIETPRVSLTVTDAVFWGWTAADKEIKGYSYTVNGGDVVTSEQFCYYTEDAVWDAAERLGASDVSRFNIPVPVSKGSQLIRLYVEFTDGTQELFWVSELTVGPVVTEYDDAGDNYTHFNPNIIGDINGDGVINGIDSTLLLQIVADWELDSSIDRYAADINRDGTVSGADAVLLLQYLAGWDVDFL